MSNKNKNAVNTASGKKNVRKAHHAPSGKKNNKKLVIIIVSVFLSLVLLFGAIFGIVIAVKNANYVMKYGSVGIDSGVACFLASHYKTVFMRGLGDEGVEDTEKFWSQPYFEDKTIGDYLVYATEEFIKNVIASNYIFDRDAKLTREEREDIALAVEEKLIYSDAKGSKDKFNELVAKYGFDYDDFKVGTEMLYKSGKVKEKLFGQSGELMYNFPDLCDEYFKNYFHAKLLFIRTETDFVLDEEGNRVLDDKGDDKLRDLTDEEKAQKAALVEEIRGIINNVNAGKADPEIFDQLLSEHDEGDEAYHKSGYYFNKESAFTKSFAEDVGEDVVDLVRELRVGRMGSVKYNGGVCFVYRIERAERAYTSNSLSLFFSDFFSLTASDITNDMIAEIREKITPSEKWSLIDPTKIPYNTEYVARF